MALIYNCSPEDLNRAAKSIIDGKLVAFPTETVYGLGADASNAVAVSKIYRVKGRPINLPLIVHVSDLSKLGEWGEDIPIYGFKLAKYFWPGPMTLIVRRSRLAKDFVTGGQDTVGIRVPASNVALELLRKFESQGGLGIAAPSANKFGKVSPTTFQHVEANLNRYLQPDDGIIRGEDASIGIESTIIDCTQSIPIILRPGAITKTMINDLLGLNFDAKLESNKSKLKVPGSSPVHYAPDATVHLSGIPNPGDGFIALANCKTPNGAVRLATPLNSTEFAQVLYKALHLADIEKISNVFVVPPAGDNIECAIIDRLNKSSRTASRLNFNEFNK